MHRRCGYYAWRIHHALMRHPVHVREAWAQTGPGSDVKGRIAKCLMCPDYRWVP